MKNTIETSRTRREKSRTFNKKISNSEESVNEGEIGESSKKLKNKFETMKGYEEARMESREMLLSIHHSLKILLYIISKMNRKLEDEKIKRMTKKKGKKISNSEESVNEGEIGESSKKLKKKFKTMKGYEGDERVMFEFILRDFMESEIWDKVKEPLSLRLNEDD
nr:hypothetical protein [Tanacetum cinerariifolium]